MDFLKFLGVVVLAIICILALLGVVGGWMTAEIQKTIQGTNFSSILFIIIGILAFIGLIFVAYYFRKH